MDHLPAPRNPALPPLIIPYLCTVQYDNKGFPLYPQRRGWDKSRMTRGDFREHPKDDTASFLQAWLYFGLLSEVLGVEVDEREFLNTIDGAKGHSRPAITTVALPKYLDDWKRRVDCLSADERRQRLIEVSTCFRDAASVGRYLGFYNSSSFCPLPSTVCLSILVLVQTLEHAVFTIWGRPTKYGGPDLGGPWGTSELLESRMYEAGWCRTKLVKLVNFRNPAALWYASLLQGNTRPNHGQCNATECVGNTVDLSTYQTKHVTDGCDCEFLQPDDGKIRSLLEKGKIPVVRLAAVRVGGFLYNPRIEVDEAGSVSSYTAISHLWRDGLGNVGRNALPTCQLVRLSRLVQKLAATVESDNASNASSQALPHSDPPLPRFWIDTLCIPVAKTLKALAISRIAQTFKGAQRALVLDADLEQASCCNSRAENMMRIFCSGWMERLWTFEECVLAQSEGLYVQFLDGIVPLNRKYLDSLLGLHTRKWESLYEGIVTTEVLSNLLSMRSLVDFSHEDLTENTRINMLWISIHARTTTKPEDEPLVLAALLGLDVGEVHKSPAKDRMRKLFSLKAEWPRHLLFADGPRLRTPGYQWAPSSFLRSFPGARQDPPGPIGMGVRTEDGLIVRYPGFVLLGTPAKAMSLPMAIFDAEKNRWYSIEADLKVENTSSDALPWDLVCPRQGIRSGFLIGKSKRGDGKDFALLVEITKEENGILYASFGLRTLVLELTDPGIIGMVEMNAPWTRPEVEKQKDAETSGLLSREVVEKMFAKVERRGEEQRWCVG